ncbi:MAG: BatD family protein [Gammaproteobacteria bacterium]|nr:BatD family protein [Gammaproteobacteria bacterium]
MVRQKPYFFYFQQHQYNSHTARQGLLTVMLFLILLMTSSPLMAKVSASTGRTVMSIDETIVLEIKSENGSGKPDLSELGNDFKILGRSQSQNYSMINGHASSTHAWKITLLAKRTGEVTIPEIQVGNEKTQPIHLVINIQTSTPALDGKDLFLKITLSDNDKRDFYVQQQILVKIQLFHRIRFTNATLSNLELNNTVVEKLGNDNNYSKVIANNRYNITEQYYAIFPQQSGTLTIPALTFSANAEISQNFSLFSRPGRAIISRTKPITLNILPIPENYTGKNWLPAENLVLESEILEDINSIKSGEAITRHIVVRATGLLASQLPATSVTSSRSIKAYPDKEKLNVQMIDGKVVGIRRDTIAIIPLKTGNFTLPEIKIDWWNTKTNQQETAILPARTLLAQGNPELANNSGNSLSSNTEILSKKNTTNTAANTKQPPQQIIEKVDYKDLLMNKNPWFWASLTLLFLWLVTLALLLSAKKKRPSFAASTQRNNSNVNTNHEKYLQILYGHCQENDAHRTTKALVKWAKYYFNQASLSGLSQIIELIDDVSLIDAINHLESSQYSINKQHWNGDALRSAITHFIEQDEARKEMMKQDTIQDFVPLNP